MFLGQDRYAHHMLCVQACIIALAAKRSFVASGSFSETATTRQVFDLEPVKALPAVQQGGGYLWHCA